MKSFNLIFFLLVTHFCFGQSEPLHRFDYIQVTDFGSHPTTIPVTIFFTKNESMGKYGQIVPPKNDPNYVPKPPPTKEREIVIYKNLLDKKMTSRTSVWTERVIVEENLEPISWKISKQKKKIGSYDCIKAEGKVKGRIYTAWFTPEIPISNGPWQLRGLPGLILEAEDATKEVKFLFEGLKLNIKEKAILESPVQFKGQKKMNYSEMRHHFRKVTAGYNGMPADVTPDHEIKLKVELPDT